MDRSMKIVRLNGEKFFTKEVAHDIMKNKFDFSDYYGENLDALWDLLSTESEETHIILLHAEKIKILLADYGEELVRVFQEAEEANAKIRLTIL